MKLRKYSPIFATAAVFILMIVMMPGFSSCTKGDTGPAGPQGDSGLTGPSGVANILTVTYTVNSFSWSSTVKYNWVATFADTNISDYNNDAVLAYWSTAIGADWIALPSTSVINKGDQLAFRYNNDSVSLTYYTGGMYTGYPGDSVTYAPSVNLSTIYFKVTIVPPALAMKYPGINWKNATEALKVPEVQAALRGK